MSPDDTGARFEVWAPAATRVEVVIGDDRTELEPHDGWFRGEILELSEPVDYSFVLDGGPPRPDPRSHHQPTGVHGPSRVVDHSRFEWSDAGWRPPPLRDWIVYELHTGTFTPEGTCDAAIGKLDHLAAIGVTAIELMPVAEFPGERGWGYDGVYPYAPHHAYGGPEGLKRLVDACHRHGLAVVLDVVTNHLGPAGNYLAEFGPYFTDRYSTPWGRAINLDGPDSDEVRRFFVDNALYWLRDYHFDALRIDAVHAIVDTSAVHILEQMAREVDEFARESGRDVYLIAESDLNDPRIVRRREEGGYGLDAQWSDDFHHAVHALLTGESYGYYRDFGTVDHLARAFRDTFVYAGRYSKHRRRVHGRSATGIPKHRFLAYLQDHDLVGNRGGGERIGQIVDPDRVKLGAALVLLSPYVPMLFQGEEWGASTPFHYFTDHEDPALGRAVREGRLREFASFGWDAHEVPDPQDPKTFERSRLPWDEIDEELHAEMLDWYRRLIAIRKQFLTGRHHELDVRATQTTLSFTRGPVTVDCDFEGPSVEVRARGEVLLHSL